jgi:8-oxo-dGTP diphosphatase
MIGKIYAHLGKTAHAAASPLLRAYMKGHRRVRTLVVNEQNEVLMTRSWFGHQRWSLPGGGIRHNETPSAAAVRETQEETGVIIDERGCKHLGEFDNDDSDAPFIVDCWFAAIDKQPAHIAAKYRLEMLNVAWFPLSHLPAKRSKTVDQALKLYDKLG